MPAVDDRGHVDIDDVAVFQSLLARDAVAHDVIDRDTAAHGVTAVAEGRGDRARSDRHAVYDIVELLGRDARNDVRHERIEDLGGEPPGAAHAGEAFGAMELDDAVLGFDAVVVGDGDIFSHTA